MTWWPPVTMTRWCVASPAWSTSPSTSDASRRRASGSPRRPSGATAACRSPTAPPATPGRPDVVKPVIVEGYPPASTVEGEFRDDSGPFDLLSSAGRLGSLAWTEARLHRIVGGWAPEADSADAVVVLDRFAMGHAARSVLLVDRLPRLRELPRDALVRSPGAAADAVLEQ